ncbi:MAG: extracellular solute-binding protein [Candidatus Cohnella colombiensis]|uniref:Extracellular solute-binding protein n=1 Tax=Candidatus Cohnella colombiensis TaxID=3121368 RepID=A0AA95F0P7_9BACL|nr:MAG: extracellular solute-binding protein [Cohnella sp.]
MKITLLSVLLVMVCSLAACTEMKKETGPVEVHFKVIYLEREKTSFYAKPYEDAMEEFNRLNPKIKVIFDYEPPATGAVLKTWLDVLKQMESDEVLDIIPISPEDLRYIANKDLILDLTSYLPNNIDIPQKILDLATIDGKLLVLPYGAYVPAVLYDKDLFDQAQIPYPESEWTWEQFAEISKRLDTSYGSISYSPFSLDTLMISMGASTLSPDGENAVGYFDSPEAVRAVQWLNEYYRSDEGKKAPMGFMNYFGYFDGSETAMIIGSNNLSFSRFEGENKKKLGAAPLPYFVDGRRATQIGYSGYAISRNCKHPEAAWKFIEYLTLDSNQYSIKFAENYLPTSQSVAEAAGLNSDSNMKMYSEELNYAVKLTDGNPYFWSAWNPEMIAEFEKLIELSDDEIPSKLHELADKLEVEMSSLKLADEQQAESLQTAP